MDHRPFLPRSLGKRPASAAPKSAITAYSGLLPTAHDDAPTHEEIRVVPNPDSINSAPNVHPEFVVAVDLMLSDYSQWLNPDLRREVHQISSDGFVPLSKLRALSPSILPQKLDLKKQNAIVQSIRSDPAAKNRYDVRMIMSEPDAFWTTHEFEASSSKSMPTTSEVGGYEIRRKDHSSSEFLAENSEAWLARTVYIENLPMSIKNPTQIALFMREQLADLAMAPNPSPEVQWVAFTPPRSIRGGLEMNREDAMSRDAERSHGFAFVALREPKLAQSILQSWPWERSSPEKRDADASTVDARRVGFKTLSIDKWMKLRDEYLNYQQQLVEVSQNRSQIVSHLPASDPWPPSSTPRHVMNTDAASPSNPRPIATPPSQHPTQAEFTPEVPLYPLGCLVFVKNVHTQTNKTTLKQLLSHAFPETLAVEGVTKGKEIDYVDYQKNMDTCHVRLAHATLSGHLQVYFSGEDWYQNGALDDTPSSCGSGATKPILVEIVSGRQEEFYWMGLPEKIRSEALRKAGYAVTDADKPERDARKRRRKG